MLDLIPNLQSLHRFLLRLTWTKILQLIILFLVISVAWLAYEIQDDIIKYIQNTYTDRYTVSLKHLSPKTVKLLNETLSKTDIISAISVSLIDFRTNTTYAVYLSANSKELRDVYIRYDIENVEQPLFTNNPEHNKKIIDIINGEFDCNKYSMTNSAINMPETKAFITTECTNGIPPYYGKTIGIISIFLKREPKPEEIDQIRIIIKNLSLIIYERELR